MFGEIAALLPEVMELSRRWLLPALTAAAAIRVFVSVRFGERA